MNVQEWTEYGLAAGHLISHKGTHQLTQKYYEAVGQTPPVKGVSGMKEAYKKFIEEAEVPYRIELGQGKGSYTCNAYSIPGEQGFTKALRTPGLDYKRLVEATKAFYKDPRNTRPMVGKYFKDGLWESVYEQYKEGSQKPLTNTQYL